ncbi:MAG: carboxylesterase family protein, partial [Gammaproteobacteria bacterium]|nr:carboxylesterase family protein [Gammaproteobacteria bacterium]
MNRPARSLHYARSSASLPRLLLLVLATAVFSGVTASATPLPTVTGLIPGDPVKVDGGLIAGKVLPSGVLAYFGVPFAAPPLRDLRWRPPQPVSDWSGVYNADRFAPECIQSLRGSRQNHYFGNEAISEDCLYLNIWKPAVAHEEPLPVVVWIYGGAWAVGSSAMRNYSGEFLARKGVIYVSMNYRVGPFGFMAHPELSAESPHNASGNFGHLDQVSALEWVKRNIATFGGDPDNVSIIGQSAGSMSVSSLQASPLARGLFHRAIGLSGSSVSAAFAGPGTLLDGEKSGLRLQEELKSPSITAMRYLPPDDIFNQARESRIRFGPVVDGWFLPRSPYDILTDGSQNDIPLLIGYTRDEGFSPLARAKNVAEYRELAAQRFD